MIDILAAAKAIENEIVQNRRHIHANPEVAYEEHGTAAFVANELRQYGLKVQEGVGGTGVVALLEGARPGPCVALRADMDALRVVEDTGLPFAAKNGRMHACGHDGHTSILLGAARVLVKHREHISGTVKFLFQPAEEAGPLGGAQPMIDAGAMENPKVDYVFALHLWPEVPLVRLGLKWGR